jgi:Reverse transcriptase (RNA-dependent DNA polymerase)
MKKKSEAHETLSLLFARDGVPSTMIMDGAREQVMGDFRKKCREAGTYVRQTEPHTPFSNAAESAIRELKKAVGRQMVRSKAPKVLWDHCVEREAYVRSNTVHDVYALDTQVPETIVSGETSDISTFAEFAWYEWVKFRDTAVSFPEDTMLLGRDLGPAIDIGPAHTRKILKANGQIVYRSTVRPLTPDELASPEEGKGRVDYDNGILQRLGDPTTWQDLADDPEFDTPKLPSYEDDSGGTVEQRRDEEGHLEPAPTPDSHDQYIGAEVLLPTGDRMLTGRVTGRKRDSEGNPIGTASTQPVLDTRVYTVEFPDGDIGEYAANVIAENMYAQCDIEGNQYLLLDAIVDHRKDGHAVEKADMYIYTNGRKNLRKTTHGWHLCVLWKDGTTSWERLADLKESNPVDVAEYAVANGIREEPAFVWWVPHVIKKRDRIICSIGQRAHKKDSKFGIRIPRTWDEAVTLDKANGDTQWQDGVREEMAKVRVAFKILEDGVMVPPTYQQIRCHLIFDLKIENFRRKARFVAGGHTTKTPATLTYSSVVSRESVRIALTLAALNDLEVKSSDIENAYLTAPVAEKIWTILGPEFGTDKGKKAIVVRSLYGLKSSGAAFRNHLADCMRHLGWTSCLADPDVWYKAEVRPEDGFQYYAYCLLYVDDALVIHHDATTALDRLDKYFKMKAGSIGDPDFYLGAKLKPVQLSNGVEAWGMSASKYIQGAVMNVKSYLKAQGNVALPKRAATPFAQGYRPEMDTSAELDPERASYYQSQIGVLRWCVELGRVDIITEVSMLASHLALPREGHLEAAFHIFAYLEKKHNSRLVFDPTYPTIDKSKFKEVEWKAFYGDAKEAIPLNAPPPRGKDIDLRLFVDSDHAGDHQTRRSRTGFFIMLNQAPIVWYSKRQPTVESSVFGAEFVAMKNGMEALRGLRYKLRMMGVPIDGPSYVFGDNMSVIHNTQRPESMLKKKSNSICYHAIREAVAMGEILTAHVSTHENPADICTKVLPGGAKRDYLISLILHDICD